MKKTHIQAFTDTKKTHKPTMALGTKQQKQQQHQHRSIYTFETLKVMKSERSDHIVHMVPKRKIHTHDSLANIHIHTYIMA